MATDKPNLLNLPSKLIIRIFSYLPVSDLVLGVRPTCQRFRQVSMVSELWKHVEIVNDETNCAPDTSIKDFHCKMLEQKCIESVRDEDDSEGQETQDNPGGEDLTVRTVATSVVERGSVWSACSVTGQMFYPRLQQLTLKGTCEQWDFLVRYKHLTFLHIQLQDKAETAHFFETLRELTSLKTLEFLLLDDFENPSSLGDAECIKDYFRTGPKLRRMCLEFNVRAEIMKTILEHCSELTDLLVWKSDFTSEVFQTVCENPNPVLSSLRIIKHPALDDACVDAIPRAFPNLGTLELPLNHRTTNEGMRRLLKRCSQLTVLELNMSDQPSCDTAESVSNEIIHGESFEHEAHEDDSGITNDPLDSDMVNDDPDDTHEGDSDEEEGEEGTDDAATSVSGDTDPDPDNLEECSGDFLQELASEEKRGILQKLHLHNFLFSDANAFTALCRNQRNLRDVSLLHCRTRDEDIVALVENCRLLQSVTIESSEASSRAACALLNNLPCLVELTFNYNSANLGTPGGRRMSRKRTSSGKLCELKQKTGQRRLNSLWIRSSYLDFTPSGLAALGSFCPSLVFLYINENVLLDDNGFMNILRCCAALQELRIEYFCSDDTEREAGQLTDDSLSHLLTHGRELRTVALPHCPLMTCPALARVIVRSPRLARFYLGVYRIQDRGDNFSRRDDPRVRALIRSVQQQLTSLTEEKKAVRCVWPAPLDGLEAQVACFVRRLRAHHRTGSRLTIYHR